MVRRAAWTRRKENISRSCLPQSPNRLIHMVTLGWCIQALIQCIKSQTATLKERTSLLGSLIRQPYIKEHFDHFQSVESTNKRREVHRSALPKVKCPFHGSEMTMSAHFWKGKWRERTSAHKWPGGLLVRWVRQFEATSDSADEVRIPLV